MAKEAMKPVDRKEETKIINLVAGGSSLVTEDGGMLIVWNEGDESAARVTVYNSKNNEEVIHIVSSLILSDAEIRGMNAAQLKQFLDHYQDESCRQLLLVPAASNKPSPMCNMILSLPKEEPLGLSFSKTSRPVTIQAVRGSSPFKRHHRFLLGSTVTKVTVPDDESNGKILTSNDLEERLKTGTQGAKMCVNLKKVTKPASPDPVEKDHIKSIEFQGGGSINEIMITQALQRSLINVDFGECCQGCCLLLATCCGDCFWNFLCSCLCGGGM